MGHGEVVGMKLPSSKVAQFADVYFSLYNPKTKGKNLEWNGIVGPCRMLYYMLLLSLREPLTCDGTILFFWL